MVRPAAYGAKGSGFNPSTHHLFYLFEYNMLGEKTYRLQIKNCSVSAHSNWMYKPWVRFDLCKVIWNQRVLKAVLQGFGYKLGDT